MQKQERLAPAYACLQKEWTTTIKKDSGTYNLVSINCQENWFRKMELATTSDLLWNDLSGKNLAG